MLVVYLQHDEFENSSPRGNEAKVRHRHGLPQFPIIHQGGTKDPSKRHHCCAAIRC